MSLKTLLRASALGLAASGLAAAPASAQDLPAQSSTGAVLAPGPAAAATAAEAQRLTDLLRNAFGPGVITDPAALIVTPEADHYKVTVNVGLMVPKGPNGPQPVEVTTGDFVALLTPVDDGTWHVVSDGLPAFTIKMPDQSISMAATNYKFDGVFDPKLFGFSNAVTAFSGLSVASQAPDASVQTQITGQATSTQTSQAGSAGTVTSHLAQTVDGFGYNIVVTPKAGSMGSRSVMAPMMVNVSAHADKLTTTLALTNQKLAPTARLWAFVRTHWSKEQFIASQAEFKGLLLDAIPLASSMAVETDLQHLVVQGPQGVVSVGDFYERLDLGGGAAQNGIAIAVKAADIVLPARVVPAWAAGLTPTSIDVSTTVGPLHVNDVLLKLIASFDADNPSQMTGQETTDLARILGYPQQLVVTLPPSTIKTSLVTLKMQGDLHFTETGAPIGAATVTAVGLDKAINAIQRGAQTDPNAAGALNFLTGIRLLANVEPDGLYSWTLGSKPDGTIMLNGKPITEPKTPPVDDTPPTDTP